MPGLLRGVARTAVISGTATAVSNRVSRRQANRWAQQGGSAQNPQQQQYAQPQYAQPQYTEAPQQAPPQPPAPSPTDTISALKELGALYQQGILTEAEFAAQKAKILGT
ncbi:SHOCT domain-containing protein [Gordonia sp. 'Campus']|uniref:SHOCT domain-containing protein n=1 Tax=Gordonia sp. 'Campus' TaxID=2915824 RepID=UPI001EE413DB|nr:SHOCT domain-containing protein [Gordonia sp. 'Campus']